ncbi:MAG: exopolyphosphatase [Lautropia sp.]
MLQPDPTDAELATPDRRRLAAVDLGSNSFRLLIVDVDDSSAGAQIRMVDQIKESVRLGAGLDHERELSPSAQQSALAALGRFSERLRGFHPESVRAVATNTFRVARNRAAFLEIAGRALGFPIEVIAGREEARLIYVGASHALPLDHQPRLVVDIGGGSTECIIGIDHEPKRRESFQMGCVALTQEFFADGRITRAALRRARLRCGELLAAEVRAFARIGWRAAIGTSGTAKSLSQIGAALTGNAAITRTSLAAIEAEVLRAGAADALAFDGLKPDRRAVFCGGLAAMQAAFEEFDIDEMSYCDSALREGILYDLLGRASGSDRREITISHLVERYRMADAHGREVAKVACELLSQLSARRADPAQLQMLAWAARIREIGSFIAHADAHKHGAYIVANADLPGFSGAEQRLLALLVLGQTGGLRKLRPHQPSAAEWRMILCLRLAVILQRRRDGRETPIRLRAVTGGTESGWRIELAAAWSEQHPLTSQSLADETAQWQAAGIFVPVDFVLT